MRILVAEDDFTLQRLLATILARQGIDCTLANDGRSALEAWEEEVFDFIFMDVQMPVLDGLEAARLIRERERSRGGHTAIIGVTAFAMDTERQMCLDAGMDDVVTKPIDLEILFGLIGKRGEPND
jgi:CheY-like chemotaxis protein